MDLSSLLRRSLTPELSLETLGVPTDLSDPDDLGVGGDLGVPVFDVLFPGK